MIIESREVVLLEQQNSPSKTVSIMLMTVTDKTNIEEIIYDVYQAVKGESFDKQDGVMVGGVEKGRLGDKLIIKRELGGDLTPREKEVLTLVARGVSNVDIAKALYISDKTVRNHVSSILRKLKVRDRTQAAIYAIYMGLIPFEDSPYI
jgi:DNA-binding NarL/FixJ family response regulator